MLSVSLVFDNKEQGRDIEKNFPLARAVTHLFSWHGEARGKKKGKNSPASISIWSHRSRQNGVSNLSERESMSFHRQPTYHPAISQDDRCRGIAFCTISPIIAFSVREGLLRKRERKRGTMPPRHVYSTAIIGEQTWLQAKFLENLTSENDLMVWVLTMLTIY